MNRIIFTLLFLPLLFACGRDDVSDPYKEAAAKKIKRTVLIYAVNKSSLSYDFIADSREILQAASTIDLSLYQILVYRTDTDDSCGLYRVEKDEDDTPYFSQLVSYPRNVTSTHPDRIKNVIDYSLTLYPNSSYDLVFWGHGMSWKPYFTDHEIVNNESYYAYGGEYNGAMDNGYRQTDWTEIDELADCVPDHVFDTIWFDCCYMTGIEVIYEFRDKCDTFVGYPTEVWSDGLQYNLILPYLLSPSHDIKRAAETFFNYYNDNSEPVTVAVLDMKYLEPVADISRQIIASGDLRPYSEELLNYSRTAGSPFYDFKQFFSLTAQLNAKSDSNDTLDLKLGEALDSLVIYHDGSNRNFYGMSWDRSNISGISTHFYQGGISRDELYYQKLDWFKKVYQ